MTSLTIAIDFDGTIAEEDYPDIGPLIPGAAEYINFLYDLGHTIIINSCRAGEHEDRMKNFLSLYGIKHHAVNENPQCRIDKYGLDCRKIGADVYIDDRNLFCDAINWPAIYSEIMKISRKRAEAASQNNDSVQEADA